MNQQAGASCPSRTPSISLAPPRALPSLPPSSYPPPPPSPVIIHLLPFCPFVVLSPPLIRRADTSQQPTTSYYSKGQGGKKIVSLSFSLPLLSRDRAHFPSFISREINQEDVSMASLYCAHRSFYTERVPHCRDATVQPRIEKARDSIERLSHDCPFLIHPL